LDTLVSISKSIPPDSIKTGYIFNTKKLFQIKKIWTNGNDFFALIVFDKIDEFFGFQTFLNFVKKRTIKKHSDLSTMSERDSNKTPQENLKMWTATRTQIKKSKVSNSNLNLTTFFPGHTRLKSMLLSLTTVTHFPL
jgi:hypothetical protein